MKNRTKIVGGVVGFFLAAVIIGGCGSESEAEEVVEESVAEKVEKIERETKTTETRVEEKAPVKPKQKEEVREEIVKEKAKETVTYGNCTEVRAAGKAPLYKGDLGYNSKLDRDGDGIACE